MRTRRQRRRYLSSLLLAIITILAILVAGMTYLVFERDRVAKKTFDKSLRYISAEPSVRADVELEDLTSMPKMKIQESIVRPVFMSTRKPYVAPPAAPKPNPKSKAAKAPTPPPDEPTPPLSGKVTGIITVGNSKVVLLNTGQSTVRLREGMNFKGWQVLSVDNEKMELTDGKVNETKYLRNYGSPKASQPPIIFE